jgi:hypothetical protein
MLPTMPTRNSNAGLQSALLAAPLTGAQWLQCVGLALLLPLAIEASKWIRRRHAPAVPAIDPQRSPRAAPSPAQDGRLDRPNQHGKQDENHE